eukprot:CAMPEP_0180293998 /NCGR_PEP_ID=MMETSP0988-20121125/17891_1 /TAXON_ID=697907 /ORGANISM="non described non described, Strain CCMP2293" /LENGTH=49 /DNA_ID= /DNA_START= /DNA_END= /DNA_ORIENTATION=
MGLQPTCMVLVCVCEHGNQLVYLHMPDEEPVSAAVLCTGGPDVIRKEAW